MNSMSRGVVVTDRNSIDNGEREKLRINNTVPLAIDLLLVMKKIEALAIAAQTLTSDDADRKLQSALLDRIEHLAWTSVERGEAKYSVYVDDERKG
ncbi:hypothetical protein N6C02_003329 [Vibrio fluvialis]|nr:hypothetical protein [Vibrio fluvialis]